MPAALGSNAAHRSKAATLATRLTQHDWHVEVAFKLVYFKPHGLGSFCKRRAQQKTHHCERQKCV